MTDDDYDDAWSDEDEAFIGFLREHPNVQKTLDKIAQSIEAKVRILKLPLTPNALTMLSEQVLMLSHPGHSDETSRKYAAILGIADPAILRAEAAQTEQEHLDMLQRWQNGEGSGNSRTDENEASFLAANFAEAGTRQTIRIKLATQGWTDPVQAHLREFVARTHLKDLAEIIADAARDFTGTAAAPPAVINSINECVAWEVKSAMERLAATRGYKPDEPGVTR